MRGLPTDKTLVLVNGKDGTEPVVVIGGSGSQGPDLATIPGVAIKVIEILGTVPQHYTDLMRSLAS